MADWTVELRMSACRWMIPFNIVLDRLKKHFELQRAKLKIAFDGLWFAVLHMRQVEHRGLGIEVRKCVFQRVQHPCEVTLALRQGRNPFLGFLVTAPETAAMKYCW